VRSNTVLDGAVRLGAQPGTIFDRNIVGYLSDCSSPMTNSIVEDWNHRMCAQPTAVGGAGNRIGTVSFRDRDAGDLRLTDRGSAVIEPIGGAAAAAIDGSLLPPDLAGASG
jgi:hypothetical protein